MITFIYNLLSPTFSYRLFDPMPLPKVVRVQNPQLLGQKKQRNTIPVLRITITKVQ